MIQSSSPIQKFGRNDMFRLLAMVVGMTPAMYATSQFGALITRSVEVSVLLASTILYRHQANSAMLLKRWITCRNFDGVQNPYRTAIVTHGRWGWPRVRGHSPPRARMRALARPGGRRMNACSQVGADQSLRGLGGRAGLALRAPLLLQSLLHPEDAEGYDDSRTSKYRCEYGHALVECLLPVLTRG